MEGGRTRRACSVSTSMSGMSRHEFQPLLRPQNGRYSPRAFAQDKSPECRRRCIVRVSLNLTAQMRIVPSLRERSSTQLIQSSQDTQPDRHTAAQPAADGHFPHGLPGKGKLARPCPPEEQPGAFPHHGVHRLHMQIRARQPLHRDVIVHAQRDPQTVIAGADVRSAARNPDRDFRGLHKCPSHPAAGGGCQTGTLVPRGPPWPVLRKGPGAFWPEAGAPVRIGKFN